MALDHDRCYRIVQSRDPRFDGTFLTAVRTTGIYCRPSCPARTPQSTNVDFYPTAAAAQQAGFRACKRCRPDASPGSPEWNLRSDVVARAVRMIEDGVVDREGVGGLARRLGYGERQVHRLLRAELGAGPLAVARAQRAQQARVLVERTTLPLVDVAFAAGFGSVRQFNDTMRAVFDATPGELRRLAAGGDRGGSAGTDQAGTDQAGAGPAGAGLAGVPATVVRVRLPRREPFAAAELWAFLSRRALVGCEADTSSVDGEAEPARRLGYRRSLDLPHGHGVVDLEPADGHVLATFRLADLRDLTAAVARCRRLLDLDADPVAVDAQLASDVGLAPLVARRPGLRSPGAVDGFEMLVRAVLGQQVSLAGGLHQAAQLVAAAGRPLDIADDRIDRLFPTPDAVASLDPADVPGPRRRAQALIDAAAAVSDGRVVLGPDADRAATRAALLAIPGIGPWTADYVALRAFGDPDVFLPGDLVIRKRAVALGLVRRSPTGEIVSAADLAASAERWSPWRSSVVHHLWAAAPDDSPEES